MAPMNRFPLQSRGAYSARSPWRRTIPRQSKRKRSGPTCIPIPWGMPSTTPYRVTSAASSQARGISVSRQKSCRTALYSVSASRGSSSTGRLCTSSGGSLASTAALGPAGTSTRNRTVSGCASGGGGVCVCVWAQPARNTAASRQHSRYFFIAIPPNQTFL